MVGLWAVLAFLCAQTNACSHYAAQCFGAFVPPGSGFSRPLQPPIPQHPASPISPALSIPRGRLQLQPLVLRCFGWLIPMHCVSWPHLQDDPADLGSGGILCHTRSILPAPHSAVPHPNPHPPNPAHHRHHPPPTVARVVMYGSGLLGGGSRIRTTTTAAVTTSLLSDAGVEMCYGSDLLGELHEQQNQEFAIRAAVLKPAVRWRRRGRRWRCRGAAVELWKVAKCWQGWLVQVLFCWHASVATEQKELTFSRLSDIAMALLHLHLPCPQLMGGCHPLPPPLLQELVRAATINCAKLFQMEGPLGQVRCVGLLPEASLVATAPLLPRGARCW